MEPLGNAAQDKLLPRPKSDWTGGTEHSFRPQTGALTPSTPLGATCILLDI